MPQLYTPFMGQAGATIGNAMIQRSNRQQQADMNQLYQQAYMGDDAAQQQLMALNPEMGMKIEQVKRQRQQDQLATQAAGDKRTMQRQQILSRVLTEAAKQPDVESANSYAQRELAQYGDIVGSVPPITEEVYQQARSNLEYGKEKPKRDTAVVDNKLIDKNTGAVIYGDTPGEPVDIKSMMPGYSDESIAVAEKTFSSLGNDPEDLKVAIDAGERMEKKIKSDKASAEKTRLKTQEARDAIATIDSMITSDLDSIYGVKEGYYPDVLRSQKGKDLMAKRKKISGLLQLAAAGKLKGQGQISEGERQILKEASSVIADETISPELANKELLKVRDMFGAILTSEGIDIPALPESKEVNTPENNKKRWPKAPAIGTRKDGYTYKGGDPSKKDNWEK